MKTTIISTHFYRKVSIENVNFTKSYLGICSSHYINISQVNTLGSPIITLGQDGFHRLVTFQRIFFS